MSPQLSPSCVIVADWRQAAQQFWSGTRWVNEYPEARVYSPHDAGAVRWQFTDGQINGIWDGGRGVCVVADYGLDTERKV